MSIAFFYKAQSTENIVRIWDMKDQAPQNKNTGRAIFPLLAARPVFLFCGAWSLRTIYPSLFEKTNRGLTYS